MTYNDSFFLEALRLAEEAKGKTGGNPNVGAVVVKDGRIVGRGSTQAYGKNHAEVEALLDAGKLAKGADLYVTLEPCCHYGKTPPCTEAIIKAGIKRVFAGIEDPDEKVSGKGFKTLEHAGIEVVKEIHKEDVSKQLEIYLTNRQRKRPFIIAKNAISLDGKIACSSGYSKWITSEKSREYVHKLRAEIGVILTGINTVLHDDPLLTVRLAGETDAAKQTRLRIVLDSRLQLPIDSKIATTSREIPTLVFKAKNYEDKAKEEKLTELGVEVASLKCNSKGELSLTELVEKLYQRDIQAVMIEAGAKLNTAFMLEKLIDKVYLFIAPKILGGDRSLYGDLKIETPKDAIKMKQESLIALDEDILIIAYPIYNNS